MKSLGRSGSKRLADAGRLQVLPLWTTVLAAGGQPTVDDHSRDRGDAMPPNPLDPLLTQVVDGYLAIRTRKLLDQLDGRIADWASRPALARLGFIRAAQSVGLSLGEIREILAFRDRGEPPCSYVALIIERHAEELSERIEAMERMRRDLIMLARRARRLRPDDGSPLGYCHIIEGKKQPVAG